MNCSSASDLMMKYMDGTLQQDEVVELNKHLSFCEKCKEEFSIFDDILKQFDVMEDEENFLGQDFNDEVMEIVQEIGYIKKPTFLSKILFAISSTSIMLFAIMVLVVTYFKDGSFVAEKISNQYFLKGFEFIENLVNGLESSIANVSVLDFGIFGKVYIFLIFIVLCYGAIISFKNFHKYYDRKKQQRDQLDFNN